MAINSNNFFILLFYQKIASPFNVALAELNINTTTPTFNALRCGTFELNYVRKQEVGEFKFYVGSFTVGEDASGTSYIYINLDGLSRGSNDIIEGEWYIDNTDLNGEIYSFGNITLCFQKGKTTVNTSRLTSNEAKGLTVNFRIMATRFSAISNLSED